MHVCCNEASLPLTCCHLPPTLFVAISLSSCDPCVLQWPLPRPLLCRLREATTPLSCWGKGDPPNMFFLRWLLSLFLFFNFFFFFLLLRCTTRCHLGIHVYIVFLCVRTCKIAHPLSCSKRCVDRFAKARHSTFYFPKPLCSCSLSVFLFLPTPIFCPCLSLHSSLLLLFASKCVKFFFFLLF